MASSAFFANGDIRPCRFVTQDGDFLASEANANDKLFGVSQEGTRTAPIPDTSETLCAKATEQFRMYQDGEIALLQLGDTVTAGQDLKSDSDGLGVPALTTGTTVQQIGAVALQGGALNEKVLVHVRIDSKLPAVA